MDYSEICYKKQCLTQVIIRFDFLEFIENSILFNDNVEKVVVPIFPKRGMQQIVRFQTMNLIVDSDETKTERSTREGLQQEFVNAYGNKLILANKFIVLEINEYTKYEDQINILVPVLSAIMSKSQLTAVRTGIRYINEFGANGLKVQKSFFASPVAAFADTKILSGEKTLLIRSMALSEYIIEDMKLNFRYGQYNPEYPKPMKKARFVLDYDCFCEEPAKGIESMLEHINKGHDAIQDLFEHSITEKLKKVMRDE